MLVNQLVRLKSETLIKLSCFSWWVQAVNTPVSSGESLQLLRDIDEMLLRLEINSENKSILINKIKELSKIKSRNYLLREGEDCFSIKDLSLQEHEDRRKIWDFLNEIKACIWLDKNGYSDIEVVPVSKNKTPDLLAQKDWFKFYIEVKSLHEPRDQEKRLLGCDIRVQDVEQDYHSALQHKVTYFVKNAEEKFNAVCAENRIIIIFFSLSISALITNSIEERDLRNILGSSFMNGLKDKTGASIIFIPDS